MNGNNPREARDLSVLERGLYAALSAASGIAGLAPDQGSLARRGRLLGNLMYALQAGRRRQALANLQLIYADSLTGAERRRIARQSFQAFSSSLFEMLWRPERHGHSLDDWVYVEGMEHLDAAKAMGKGVILAAPHLGNWFVMIRALQARGHRIHTLHRPAAIAGLRAYTVDLCARFGLTYIETPLGKSGVANCLGVLRDNECLLVIADRRSNDYQVNFMGQPAWTAHGVSTFHRRSGAALLPVIAIREHTRHRVVFEPPIGVADRGSRDANAVAILEAMNDVFAKWIYRYPEQWLWQHDRWRGKSKRGE